MLAPWRKETARHNPGKVITDLAIMFALGGDCLADVASLRAQPSVFGAVASDPTASRTIDALAADAPRVLKAIDRARAAACKTVWGAAGERAPDHDVTGHRPLIVDLDATLVTAHSDKEHAAPTFKHEFGFHPLGLRSFDAGAEPGHRHFHAVRGMSGRPGRTCHPFG